MNFSSVISVLIVLSCLFIFNTVAIDFELELLQVLFRHGDRTPEKEEVYKTDPYDPHYYEPFGYGQLIKTGKQREYKMGQMLRERYNEFLGDFNNDEVYAYSTNYDRTKMSLHLALAGLYPPTQKTSWSEEIYWSPIPTHYEKKNKDYLQVDLFGRCSQYGKFIYDAERSPEIVKKMEKYKDFAAYVQNKTEINSVRPFWLFLVYNNLCAVKSMGLPLPNWCSEEDFNKLKKISAIALETVTFTERSKKMMAGLMIEKFLENAKTNSRRKIHMFSAHDVSISAFTRAHNLTAAQKVPSYGSAVIIEKLRGTDGHIYVRMFMWTGDTEQIVPLTLDNCSNECPLTEYEKIIKSMILTETDKKCFSKNYEYDSDSRLLTGEELFKRYLSDFKYSKKFLSK